MPYEGKPTPLQKALNKAALFLGAQVRQRGENWFIKPPTSPTLLTFPTTTKSVFRPVKGLESTETS